ncbi:hypothetical protein ACQ4LE_004930 [Meloidogyne hapla]|uniref:Uncharacterized protein n=1 Tax=Meloidogyne hapla TaxID=6305 RepID=A0A1I8B7H2_MELHA
MVTTQHGPQCICEICTCGRHQCPLNRSSATGFAPFGEQNNGNGSSHFYRKEFATTANVSERAKPARPNPELTLDRTIPFHSTERPVDSLEQQKALTEARNQRFVTSAAFKKRGQNSQIQLAPSDGNQQMHRSTYREESERALQNGVQQRVRPTRPAATTPIFGGNSADSNIQQTVNQSEYAPKRSERVDAVRPKTSDLWKNANGTSLERSGVNAEYGKGGKGERPAATRPRESNILRGEGPFHVETNQRSEYGPKRGERFEAKRHVESEIWKNEGPNEHTTVNRSEYKGGRGERFEMRKPLDSDILRVQGPFESLSVAHSEYAQRGPGDRFASQKQGENEEHWHNVGKMAAEGSVSRNDYQHDGKRGDRHPMHRPKDTELFDLSGPMGAESTVNATEYSHTRGERAERKVPQPSGIFLPPPGSEFAPESTVSREHYGHKELVERAHPVPRRSEMVLSGPEESFSKNSNYTDNFQQIPSDTYASRPKAVRPSTALKLQGDREFKSGYGSEFTNKSLAMGPCPAGELVETLKGHACKVEDKNGSHIDTNNFHFHSVNKGHHLYRSKENLAES